MASEAVPQILVKYHHIKQILWNSVKSLQHHLKE